MAAAAPSIACRVIGLEQATHDIRILRLESAMRFEFRAGQYAKLGFAALPPRDYSMASRPDEPHFEFHIRDVGDGASRYAVRRLAFGETVSVAGPLGDAYLRDDHRGCLVAIAGGSGLAPMKSIVETALRLDPSREIHLYFGVRAPRDLYLLDHFMGLARGHRNFRFMPVIAEPSGSSPWRTGLVGDVLAADMANLGGTKAYLAGPPAMVEATVALLRSRGLPAPDIHADPFYSEEENRRRGQSA